EWIVAVPDYTGRIGAPGSHQAYGFPGVNAMRGLYTWLGIAILPLTALYATSRAWSGQGDHVAMPLVRVVTVSVGVLSYTWLWGQAVALTNQVTTAILSVHAVSAGIYKMFTLLVTGAALVGIPLVGEILLATLAGGLIAMIFLKVVLILAGALVYAIGPLMIGLAPTERGHAIARAWASLAVALFAIGVLWTSVFAISAVLLNDARSGALLLGGGSSAGRLLSGVVIAMAAIAGFYANIKLTKAIAGIVGGQLSGALSQIGAGRGGGLSGLLGGGRGTAGAGAGAAGGGAAGSLRGFAAKVGGGVAGAAAAAMPAGRAGQVLAGGAGAAGALARGGLIGAGATLAGRGLAGAARSSLGRAAGATRAGAVATRMARSGQRDWKAAGEAVAAGGAVGVVGGATAANKARRARAGTAPTPANGNGAAGPGAPSGPDAPTTPSRRPDRAPGVPVAAPSPPGTTGAPAGVRPSQ
ncbi:MAG: hypothetical protein LC713_06610, partial [Actinobacteria bacterium]|nr:hypothetical protein [Actinomycetota bacterium]